MDPPPPVTKTTLFLIIFLISLFSNWIGSRPSKSSISTSLKLFKAPCLLITDSVVGKTLVLTLVSWQIFKISFRSTGVTWLIAKKIKSTSFSLTTLGISYLVPKTLIPNILWLILLLSSSIKPTILYLSCMLFKIAIIISLAPIPAPIINRLLGALCLKVGKILCLLKNDLKNKRYTINIPAIKIPAKTLILKEI